MQQTPNLLILRLRPTLLWITAGIFAAAGLFVLANGKITTLTCSRTKSTNCQLVASGLLESQSKQIPLNTLQGAKVEVSSDSDGSTYRVIILTSSGDIPFTSSLSSGEGDKQAIASHIEKFVKNPQMTSLKQEQDDRLWIYLIGGICVTVGCVVLLAPVVTCVFDKTLDTLTVKRLGLLGTKVIERRLGEIKDVLVEESTDSEGGSTYRVSFVLVGGDAEAAASERLPVTSYYSSGRKSKEETASCIKKFLNLNT